MRALRYHGPLDLRVEEVTPRPLGVGDVRVLVESAGVCGTDVRIVKGHHAAVASGSGRIPGHEIVGRVVEAGAQAAVSSGGGLVFVAPNIGCGVCTQCRIGDENLCPSTKALGITLDGAFAESLVVPARAVERGNLIPLPEMSADAAVLIEPLACVLRGQQKVRVGAPDTVLVCGGGPIGLLHVALAHATDAAVIICSEPSPARREAARLAGAQIVVDPMTQDLVSEVASATQGRGADVVITAAPVPALQSVALELAATAGRVLFFAGLPKDGSKVDLDTNLIHYKELVVVGTTASTLQNCRDAARLVADGVVELERMVSHRFGLGDAAAAIAATQDPTALKVVMKPAMAERSVQ